MAARKYLIVVSGATASGKTSFAVQLAQHFRTEMLSCDSRQFFREMHIGTAKPTAEEMQDIPHHFIGHRSIFEPYNVADFEQEALELLADLYQRYDTVVAAGGSGLYLKALCEGLDEFPEIPESIRQSVRQLYENEGLIALQRALAAADPVYYASVDRHNPHRLIRALEVCWATERPFSAFRKNHTPPRPFTPIYIQLDWPRTELYERINQRVEAMLAQGLLDEAQMLYPHRNLIPLQTVGYQELFDYFDGQLTLEEAVLKIKQHSRNYAKRQLTWWRRDGYWQLFHPSQLAEAIEYIEQRIARENSND
ncbi:MAG TPA: tRNA (adenosine(37)-N6)-dimethylallyltransferase MiaA [Saprospiraceae bacterium]|nr:tRNA (adenosine(37)-N6)-dimethylallyltransferase MiaA [Saprospiraceae bacterium]HMP24464.1 tRNA (adenosine(37)-N6)-dimethylallyltransferase MiaA [Saprospiraceae bacterium]